jgi:hypothetical protein
MLLLLLLLRAGRGRGRRHVTLLETLEAVVGALLPLLVIRARRRRRTRRIRGRAREGEERDDSEHLPLPAAAFSLLALLLLASLPLLLHLGPELHAQWEARRIPAREPGVAKVLDEAGEALDAGVSDLRKVFLFFDFASFLL